MSLLGTAFATVCIVWLTWFAMVPKRVYHPVRDKLVEMSPNGAKAEFSLPPGEPLHLVVALPQTNDLPDTVSAYLRLTQGSSILFVADLARKDFKECNWLDKHELQGYLIEPVSHFPKLSEMGMSGGRFTVELMFEPAIPTPASLWLAYLRPTD